MYTDDRQSASLSATEEHRDDATSGRLDLIEIAAALWTRRWLAVWTATLTTIGAIGVSFALPSRFTATTTILPEVETSPLPLASLTQLATSFGVSLSGRTPATELYPVIMRSDEVLRQIVYGRYPSQSRGSNVNLIEYWGIRNPDSAKTYEDARKRLRNQAIEIDASRRTGVIELSVSMGDPLLAARVANRIVEDLDQYVRAFQRTSASEQRKWIEQRLQEVQGALERSEASLTDFRRKNRLISGSPELELDEERLSREVQLNTTLFVELKRQYEVVRIEEIKNIPIVNVLDSAQVPARRSSPKRRVIASVGLLFGVGLGTALAVVMAQREKLGGRWWAVGFLQRVRRTGARRA